MASPGPTPGPSRPGPSPGQPYQLRQEYRAPPQQHAAAPSSSNGQLPQGFPAAPGPAKPGPAPKTWTDDEGEGGWAGGKQHHHSYCTRFKFAIWLGVVVLLVSAGVGLSVTMAIVQDNRNDKRPPSPPPPPSPPSSPDDDPSGGDGSSGDVFTGPLPDPGTPPFPVPAGSRAIWWDEFSGDSLDRSKWAFDIGTGDWGWGNNEQQYYTDSTDNAWVEGDKLHITALRDGNSYTSARLNTKPTASFWPGVQLEDGTTFSSVHVEARMQLPQPGPGLWPAFWLFPSELVYGKWAASGEIDIMESKDGMDTITHGIHFGGEDPQNQKNMTRTRQDDRSPYSDAMHTYAVDWTLDRIDMYVDGVLSRTYQPRDRDPYGWWTTAPGAPPSAPFNEPFYIILNLAVGGLFPEEVDDSTPFPATLIVDYVRVWGTPL